jgi:hypothetical protein
MRSSSSQIGPASTGSKGKIHVGASAPHRHQKLLISSEVSPPTMQSAHPYPPPSDPLWFYMISHRGLDYLCR